MRLFKELFACVYFFITNDSPWSYLDVMNHAIYLQALFPVSFLFSRSLKFPVRHEEILKQYSSFPYLSIVEQEEFSDAGIRKVYLELNIG